MPEVKTDNGAFYVLENENVLCECATLEIAQRIATALEPKTKREKPSPTLGYWPMIRTKTPCGFIESKVVVGVSMPSRSTSGSEMVLKLKKAGAIFGDIDSKGRMLYTTKAGTKGYFKGVGT
jgi:hypothetical protein